ncbi:MAG: ATP-dependent zinc protease [Betaproteobacteria bacterium]|nr:ATP-dependent zinc protease [Betaproteobacteria bacterium]
MVGNPPIAFEAKIDTGADISSIDAAEITPTRRERGRWIDFVVARADGTRVRLSAPLVRYARIKQAGMRASRRPVVLLEICLGSRSRAVEVSLANRAGLDFDVLVGRNVLSGHFVVDPARDHALPPDCAQRNRE